ncbi:MAG: metallophosphoesterase family protein [bacterium]
MKIALLSDLHGNGQALEAVAGAVEREGAAAVLCLGDVVGYGARPSECAAWARRECEDVVRGNHDHAVAGSGDLGWFNSTARRALIWTRDRLTAEERGWLGELPYTVQREWVLLSHGHPLEPEAWVYVTSAQDARLALRGISSPFVAVGHSHKPFCYIEGEGSAEPVPGEPILLSDRRAVLNPGSVGQPRDGDPRASWAVLDDEEWTFTLHRTEYDAEGARWEILEAGLPRELGDRLLNGR